MRPGEQQALDELKAKIASIKENTWGIMEECLRADRNGLDAMGQRGKTQEEAAISFFKHGLNDIKRADAAFTKKFPD